MKYATLRDRSISEGWVAMRDAATSKSIAQAERTTAQAAAKNAEKYEQAKALALDVILANLNRMRELQGSRVTTKQEDKKGNPITVDFDLADLVASLEKLQRTGNDLSNTTPVQVIIDV